MGKLWFRDIVQIIQGNTANMQQTKNQNPSPFASEYMISIKMCIFYEIYTADIKRQTHGMIGTIIQGYKLL
jgi:hypothetical protein